MAEKRKVLILSENEARKENGIIILTNAPTDRIMSWINTDTGLDPENLAHMGFYSVLLYQPDENPPDDLEAIGYDEVYSASGDRRDDIEKRERMHERLMDIIDTAVRAHGYKILDGDRDTVIIRFDGNGADFQIKVSDTE